MVKLSAVLGVVVLSAAALNAQQNANVKDHPLVSRFAGSQVEEYKVAEFDSFPFALGEIADTDKFAKMQTLEGKVTKFKYSMPEGHSSLEVARTYQNALLKGGFQILYTCDAKACFSPKFPYGNTKSASGTWCYNCEESTRYVGAKLARPTGDAYVSVVVNKDRYAGGVWLSIVEVKPLGAGAVTVNAAALANDISTTGHAAVYGILFDTGKAIVKAESNPTLEQIAKMLTANPQMKLHVVGHTDNVGAIAANMTLSKARADAVVDALVTNYKIVAARLQASGVGPLAPVAPNKTDDGRARNRRVELVEQ